MFFCYGQQCHRLKLQGRDTGTPHSLSQEGICVWINITCLSSRPVFRGACFSCFNQEMHQSIMSCKTNSFETDICFLWTLPSLFSFLFSSSWRVSLSFVLSLWSTSLFLSDFCFFSISHIAMFGVNPLTIICEEIEKTHSHSHCHCLILNVKREASGRESMTTKRDRQFSPIPSVCPGEEQKVRLKRVSSSTEEEKRDQRVNQWWSSWHRFQYPKKRSMKRQEKHEIGLHLPSLRKPWVVSVASHEMLLLLLLLSFCGFR